VFLVPFAAFALLSAPLQLSAEADQQAKIIVLDLVNGTELDEARLEVLGDAIVSSLAGAKVEVLSAADLRKTLEFKAEQSALGCQQQSCILDLAKVLQARYILSGSLASFKGQFILNLKLIDTKNGNLKVLLRETHEAEAGALTALARISAAKMRQALGGPPPSDAEMAVLKADKVPLFGLSLGLGAATLAGFGIAAQIQTLSAADAALLQADDRILGPFHASLARRNAVQARWLFSGAALAFGVAAYAWLGGW
jgi:TolB-like protein